MLFLETIAVNCENHMKHTNTPRGQSVEFHYVEAGDRYRAIELEGITLPGKYVEFGTVAGSKSVYEVIQGGLTDL
jgi:hypothetical protein